jgi:putative hydrolase
VADDPQGGSGRPDEEPDDDEPGPDLPGGGSSGNPFEGFPSIPGFDLASLSNLDVSQLMRMLQTSGPVNWEVAMQLASTVATEGQNEPLVDEASRAQLEELAHAAQTHVVAETGLAATFTAPVRALDRREWAALHLDALRPVLEALATTLGGVFQADSLGDDENLLASGADPANPDANPFANPLANPMAMLPMLAPLLLGVQAGSMVGYLAQHALGRYDLPLPAADAPSLCFVVRNLDEFGEAWSLDPTDLRFYIAIHEVVHAAERSVPWVRERLVELAIEYVTGYEVDPTVLELRLGDIDPADPAAIQQLAERPEELLGAMQSDRQRAVLERIRVFHAVLEGYADAVLERIGTTLIPSFGQIHEAMARHRIERGEAERFVEGLLGLAVGRDDYERGAAFCAGVVERAGADGLNRLWEREAMAPTPNEIEAPGLWLARIELDLDDGGDGETEEGKAGEGASG